MTIGIDIVGSTGLGTGTTKTLLGGGNYVLPAWARSIVAVIPIVNIDVPTVSESVLAKLSVESEDFNCSPFEVLAAPLTSCLGATVAPFVAKPEKYLMNCPVNGGDQMQLYGTALVANTAAPVMSCAIVMSSNPPMNPQRFAKMGTLTSTGTTASTEVAGTLYSFSKAHKIIEVFGAVVPDTVAAGDALAGFFRFWSTEFLQPTPLKMPFNPVPGGLSTIFSTKLDGVSRYPVEVETQPGQVNIQDYVYLDLAPAAAGNFVTGMIFE